MKRILQKRDTSLFLAFLVSASSPDCLGNLIDFRPWGDLRFADTFSGDQHSYVWVEGSATGGGGFTLNQTIPGESPWISISMDIVIGNDSTGGFGSKGWSFDLTGAQDTTAYVLSTKTAAAKALTYVGEAPVNVAISLTMSYRVWVRGEEISSGHLGRLVEMGQVRLDAKTVRVIPNPDDDDDDHDTPENGSTRWLLLSALAGIALMWCCRSSPGHA